ncbi:MAG: hypothetical protein ACOYMZ_02695 [Minisyncoccia bacterium]
MSDTPNKSHRYCFTIHNYTKVELKNFHKLAEALEKHRYISYGLEIAPENKTPHIQGYVELKTAQRYSFLHNYFNFKRKKEVLKFHVEIANGTAEDNKKYNSKDGEFFEFGESTTQGTRTDLKVIKEAVKANPKNLKGTIDEHGNNYQQIKFAESLTKYYLENRDPSAPPIVYWIYGSPGIGKTRMIYRNFKDVCPVSSYNWLGTDYAQNECFLLDDFRRDDLPFNTVLKITDRYPFTLEFKGSQIPLNSPYIIFTSPKSIEETYHFSGEDIKQLHRRIIQIHITDESEAENIDLKNLDPKYIHKAVNDYNQE